MTKHPLIGKKAKYNNLVCKIVDVVQGKTQPVARVVYAEVRSGAESVYVVWGRRRYNVCVKNLSFD